MYEVSVPYLGLDLNIGRRGFDSGGLWEGTVHVMELSVSYKRRTRTPRKVAVMIVKRDFLLVTEFKLSNPACEARGKLGSFLAMPRDVGPLPQIVGKAPPVDAGFKLYNTNINNIKFK
jgi:hypothetical protein